MKNFFLLIFFTVNISANLLSQEVNIKANVKMDLFGNLSINTELLNFDNNHESIVIDNEILIHNDYAKLIRGIKLEGVQLIEYEPESKKIDFVVNLPKGKNANYLKGSDFFITTINYLPILKNYFSKKKKFDLQFDFPEKFQIIYPDENDLQEDYIYVPPIIAGDFIKKTIHGFDVFNLKKNSKKDKRLQEVITEIDNAFSFFQKFYPTITKKPKIIFLPINSPDAKTLENVIIFDTKILDEKIPLQKRLIAHEVSHLWWGVRGITFDNHIITEGIAEYLAIKYMDYLDEDKYVKDKIKFKLFNIEGNYDFNEALERPRNKKDAFLESYELSPLVFFDMENSNIKVFDKLSEFYKIHQFSTVKMSHFELFNFLNSGNNYDLSFNFPDFFITNDNDKLFINSISKTEKNVEVEFVDNKNNVYLDTLTFSNNILKYEYNSREFNKITIDPHYKILQTTRLNDVWHANNKSIFCKNNYNFKNVLNPIVIDKSEKFVDYLFSNKSVEIENFTCKTNFWLIKKIKELKDKINKDENKIITGASTYLKKNNEYNRIEIKINYLVNEKSKFIYFYLYFDENFESLQDFKIVDFESVDFESEEN